MICPRCRQELVEVDNPMRREVRHRRGVKCKPLPPIPDGLIDSLILHDRPIIRVSKEETNE